MFEFFPGCFYKNTIHKKGDRWQDGCDYICECMDDMTGRYRCTERYIKTHKQSFHTDFWHVHVYPCNPYHFQLITDARNTPTYQTTASWFRTPMISVVVCHTVVTPTIQHHWPTFQASTRPCPPPLQCMSTLTNPHPLEVPTLHQQAMVSGLPNTNRFV